MCKIRRANQGGSVATFVVIAIILMCGLIGAVYTLKQHGDQVRKDQAIAIYDKQQAVKKTSEINTTVSPESKTNSSDDAKSTDTVTDSNSSVSRELPITGLTFNIGELLGSFLLTIALMSYISSRRCSALSL